MALIREKRFSQMNLSLHVPSRVPFQDAAAAARRQCPPPVAAASTSSTPASRASQFRLADFERVAVLGRGNGGTVYKVRHRETCALYALKVAAHALSGLAYLHARRVAHLDVKPGNLLASTDGKVKFADFGIARVLPPRAGDHRAPPYAGTAAYMSPERFDPEAHGGRYDPFAADVWGLGVTVLELLAGRYPLLPAGQKPSWAALMCAICFGEPPALPDGAAASPELRGFVAACLRKDHRERASVGELLAHPFVAGRDVAASRRALRRLVAEASSPSS
ncbi:hypothetical protein OsJ_12336 [Oryza sativa Japonica Group]|uniref:mitogen-activated protein kinase kinase n=1 Tax=Oryza sativa subsp. japonica TaxID=39947 RepID=A3AM19_ORYSJ|nr:hypothetical protein OsJ_12336 [Oryza sativa Japonica Group]